MFEVWLSYKLWALLKGCEPKLYLLFKLYSRSVKKLSEMSHEDEPQRYTKWRLHTRAESRKCWGSSTDIVCLQGSGTAVGSREAEWWDVSPWEHIVLVRKGRYTAASSFFLITPFLFLLEPCSDLTRDWRNIYICVAAVYHNERLGQWKSVLNALCTHRSSSYS